MLFARKLAHIEVQHRHLSELETWTMRESSSLAVNKCIYTRLPYPNRNGGLEQAFIEWANKDSSVLAFCKLNETRHDFVKCRYVKEDGLPAFYFPDFLVRTDKAVYLLETKAQEQLSSPNVRRKQKAAVTWCDKINQLPTDERSGLDWHYVLLGERLFYEWREKRASLSTLCDYARIRPQALSDLQGRLE